jgi:hypothetical protein
LPRNVAQGGYELVEGRIDAGATYCLRPQFELLGGVYALRDFVVG